MFVIVRESGMAKPPWQRHAGAGSGGGRKFRDQPHNAGEEIFGDGDFGHLTGHFPDGFPTGAP
jgi:hypothetical protein